MRAVTNGKITGTGTVVNTDMDAAYKEAHPALMDPLIQCRRGDEVCWIEIGRPPIKDESNEP